MSAIFSAITGGSSRDKKKTAAAPPPPPPVETKPVVYPSAPVAAGQREAEQRKTTKRVRTGMGTARTNPSRGTSILGGDTSTATKTLLGQ